MFLNNKCFSLLSLSFTVAITASVSGSGLPSSAQVPGVPGTQSSASATTATTTSAPQTKLISGHVKTDMAVAEKLLSQGKWADAEGLCRDALVSNPQDVQATLGLGLAQANEFKLDAADALFDRVLAIDPNNPNAYAGKATVMLNRLQSSNNTVRSQKDSALKAAQDYATKACTLGPANAEAHLALGMVLKEQGSLDQAASELATAVRFDPDLSYGYSSLGSIKLDQKSLVEASENFKRAIALNSGNSSAHFGLGAALLKQGQLDEAIKELNTSLYQFPNSWPVRMALGQAYQQQGNVVAALQQYQLSTLIKPENSGPYLAMADIHQTRGDFELAMADLRSGLEQSPYDLNLRERIADINLQLERPDQAIEGYRTILSMSANDNNAIKGLSQALFLKAQKATVGAMLQSNDYDTANKALAEAVKLNPNDMELRLAQAKLNSLSGAVVDPTKIVAPTTDGDRVAYAQALMSAGSFKAANDQLTQVLNNQSDPKQILALGDIAVMIKSLDCADAAYKKAQSLNASPDRVQRGLKQVAQLRVTAVESLKIANELAKKKQWDGAIAKYREVLSNNPVLPDARFGLAEALEDGPKDSVATLSESAQQYQVYLTLANDLTSKDREKLTELIEKLNDKVAKLKQKEDHDKM
ncbi:MAG: tetratricopeptide repeat protein [Candidatus Obscuribacterales bacterium]|nr:tetratricopeptide repeat protein [Candidatus Obscuribacterales bacterium]